MKVGEKGFTFIEVVVAMMIIFLASGAAVAAIFQIFRGIESNNDYMTAVRQVQNAGYWISYDAQMAQSVYTGNPGQPNLLIINWYEWENPEEQIYHSITYYFEDLTDGTGKLKRKHWSSAGANEETLIAQHIYYDLNDTDNTTKASYQNSVLTVQLTALFEKTMEIREYKIKSRSNI